MRKRDFINKISDRLEIPRDVIGKIPRITLVGNGMVTIEEFFGVVEYSEEKTLIKTNDGVFAVFGRDIIISKITEEFIELKGEIKSIEFM